MYRNTRYTIEMKQKNELAKLYYLDIRLEAGEKEAFKEAAEFAGIPLSAWVRERLRRAARRELEAAGRPIPFLKHLYGN